MTILPFLGSNRKKRKVMAQEVKGFSGVSVDAALQCINKECAQRSAAEA